jgi:hypothetical protein
MVMYMYRMGIDFASVYTTFLLDFRTVVTMWLLFFILFHHFCRYGITTRVRGAHLFSFCVVFFVFFVFVLCLVYSKLPISLDCPLLIALSVFSNVYFLPIICPMSCVPNVTSVSGLSILDYSFGFL